MCTQDFHVSKFMSHLYEANFCDVLTYPLENCSYKKLTFSTLQRKAIAQRCYTNSLTAGDIADMGGETLLKLDISKLRQSVGNLQMDANTQEDLKQALKNDKSNRRIKALRRELQKKVLHIFYCLLEILQFSLQWWKSL